MFGDRLVLAERYVELLATEAVVRGLIGPRESGRLWDRHVLNCVGLSAEIPEGSTVADIGSGAGLPGLVVAIARPDLSVTLIEPLLRRTRFLDLAVAALGLSSVEVVRARADALHGERTFDVVTSRAVAPLPRLLGWSMPLVAPTGALVALKGSSAQEEVDQATSDLAAWGCSTPVVRPVSGPDETSPTTVVRVAWADPRRVRLALARDRGRSSSPRHSPPRRKQRRQRDG